LHARELRQEYKPHIHNIEYLLHHGHVCVMSWSSGTFTQLQKASISFLMSVPACIGTAPNWQISMKFCIGDFYEILSMKSKIGQNWPKNIGFYIKTQVCFLLLVTYITQQWIEYIVAFPCQYFKYLLYCSQQHMYVNSTPYMKLESGPRTSQKLQWLP